MQRRLRGSREQLTCVLLLLCLLFSAGLALGLFIWLTPSIQVEQPLYEGLLAY